MHGQRNVKKKVIDGIFLSSFNIQGEHKVFPWLQTFITRKLRGIQTFFFLPLFKLVSKILCNAYISKKNICLYSTCSRFLV